MMKLQLTRPIAFIDLETTGVNISIDRIVEIAIVKISPDGTQQVKRKLINPLIPIPKGSSDIHGITDEMVKDAPSFKQAANELKQFMENCDMGGYNSNRFDIPMLIEEFLRIGIEFSIEAESW
jgi:DNA polymerase-3 subunit epsilon